MSSRRSDRPGTRTGTTFRRWNRSSRKRPAAISSRSSLRGGRDHPHVDLHVVVAAHPAEALLDQHPQDAALGLARHVGHFVEKQGAAVGAFEHPDLARAAALAFLAEQLEVQALGRHARGADGHELVARTRLLEPWISRATSSLPEPGGPETSTRLLAGATLAISWRRAWAAADLPIRPSELKLCTRRRRFSRLRLAASRARSTTSSRRSDLNGFSRNS